MTVSRLMEEMTPHEYALWRIKFANDPWTLERRDYMTAQTAAIFANANRDPKKREKPFQVIDFMPYAKRKQEAERKEEEEKTVKVDPMTLTWLMWKARKSGK